MNAVNTTKSRQIASPGYIRQLSTLDFHNTGLGKPIAQWASIYPTLKTISYHLNHNNAPIQDLCRNEYQMPLGFFPCIPGGSHGGKTAQEIKPILRSLSETPRARLTWLAHLFFSSMNHCRGMKN